MKVFLPTIFCLWPASVVAFEPLPQMLARLRKNYAGKMEIHGVILSDHEGQGELRYPAGGYMSATIAGIEFLCAWRAAGSSKPWSRP